MDQKIYDKLCALEQHIINLIIPIQNIHSLLNGSDHLEKLYNITRQPIQIDDKSVSKLLIQFRETLRNFEGVHKSLEKSTFAVELGNFYKKIEEMERSLGLMRTYLKAIPKREKVKLDITLDGEKINQVSKKKTRRLQK